MSRRRSRGWSRAWRWTEDVEAAIERARGGDHEAGCNVAEQFILRTGEDPAVGPADPEDVWLADCFERSLHQGEDLDRALGRVLSPKRPGARVSAEEREAVDARLRRRVERIDAAEAPDALDVYIADCCRAILSRERAERAFHLVGPAARSASFETLARDWAIAVDYRYLRRLRVSPEGETSYGPRLRLTRELAVAAVAARRAISVQEVERRCDELDRVMKRGRLTYGYTVALVAERLGVSEEIVENAYQRTRPYLDPLEAEGDAS